MDFAATLQVMREKLATERARIDRALEAISDLQKSYPVSGNGQAKAAAPPVQARPAPKKAAPKVAGRGKQSTAHLDGKRTGREPKWDVELAERLWKAGVPVDEIMDRSGAPGKASIYERAARCKWEGRHAAQRKRAQEKAPRSLAGLKRRCEQCLGTTTTDPCEHCKAPWDKG